MIRKVWNRDKWLLTPQVEHARLSGLIAASWNFPGEKPSDEVIQAIRRHDDGWKEADEKPLVNGAGAPMNFDEGDLGRSTEIWSRSARLLADDGKAYGAALVASHFLHFAENVVDLSKASVKSTIAAGKFIAEQRGVVQKGRGSDEEEFAQHLRFLQVCDAISIMLCSDFIGEHKLEDVPYLGETRSLTVSRKSDNLTLTLSPLPFKKNLRDHVNSYMVPRHIYESHEDLQGTIRGMKPTNNEVHLGGG
jgi:hypothetical protein